jgi:uncharacterized protein YbaA (DUF1428 family)
MPHYIDGFLLPIAKDQIENYRAISSQAAAVWREHGALDYRECVGEALEPMEGLASFPVVAGAKEGETVIFAYIVYESRAHRDEVNAKVMADPRMKCGEPDSMPFDCRRMAYGGFQTIVGD